MIVLAGIAAIASAALDGGVATAWSTPWPPTRRLETTSRRGEGSRPAASAESMVAAGVPEESAGAIADLSTEIGASGMEPLSDPLMLLRFYNARGRSVEAAAEMWRTTVAWRAEYPICKLMAEYGDDQQYQPDGSRASDASSWSWRREPRSAEAKLCDRVGFWSRLRTRTQCGEPIMVWRVGTGDFKGIVREDLVEAMMRSWVAHLEDILQDSRAASLRSRRLVRARLVVDVEGFGMGNVRYLPVLRRIIKLGQMYFPEVTESVTIVRAPGYIAGIYELVRPWLAQPIQEKICILGRDFAGGLKRHADLDLSMLPAFLGGEGSDEEVPPGEPVPPDALKSAA